MKSNWIRTLNLNDTILEDSNTVVMLENFFYGYNYVRHDDNGDLIIKDIEQNKELKLTKTKNGYVLRKKILKNNNKISEVSTLSYYNYNNSYYKTSLIKINRILRMVKPKSNEKLVEKTRIGYSIFELNNYESKKNINMQKDVTYVDMDDEKRYNQKPDICFGIFTEEFENDYKINSYDISQNELIINDSNYIDGNINLMVASYDKLNEGLELQPFIVMKPKKNKKIGFI